MKNKKQLYFALSMLMAFAFWTVLISCVDVKQIGPAGTMVGLATINRFIHNITGVNLTLYYVTDWLGLVPILFVFVFGVEGIIQLIKRKNIFKVDFNILILGGFYIVTIAVYLFFELVVINYRPILINGVLEASYPSSTTLLALCVVPTGIMQFNSRIKNNVLRRGVSIILSTFTVFMVTARFISGVHWFTDIIGGILFSVGLVNLYNYIVCSNSSKNALYKL